MTAVVALFALQVSAAYAAEPPTIVIDPTITTGETTAELSGSIDIHGGEYTQVYVRASTNKVNWLYGGGLVAGIPDGATGSTPFTGTVQDLEPETTYYFEVETQNGSGSIRYYFPEADPYPSATTGAATPVPPVISAEKVASVGAEEATLNATVNPKRFATTYSFEYAAKSVVDSEGWSSPNVRKSGALPPLSADNFQHPVSYRVTGLESGEQYLWRIAAENVAGQITGDENSFSTLGQSTGPLGGCPNEQFRAGLAAFLPDCRAYELATPVDKAGMNVQGLPGWLRVSSDSDIPRVGFIQATVTGIPSGGGGRQEVTPMLSSREESSWSTQNLFPPESPQARYARFAGTSENMRYALVEVNDSTQRSGSTPRNVILELIDTVTGAITPVASVQTESDARIFAADAISNDGSYVFFESREEIAPGAAPGRGNVYKWDRATGSVSLVGVLPAGQGGGAPPSGSFGGGYYWHVEGATLSGGALNGEYVEAIHAATASGSQIYFTAAGAGQVYLRRGLGGGTPASVLVSKPNAGVVDHYVEEELYGERFPAAFQEATPDGSRAFFTTHEKLTADASTGEYDEGTDLYRFDAGTESLTDITGGLESSENPNGARVVALLGASADGASGYFVARGDLDGPGGGAADGSLNIYRFEEAGSGSYQLTFVATLANEGDNQNWSSASFSGAPDIRASVRTSRVSRDGEELVFSSEAKQGVYNNNGCGTPAVPEGAPCKEIYLYSASTGGATCISCNPTGEAPRGSASLSAGGIKYTDLVVPDNGPSGYLTRNISADGSRIFFQTPDSLVPRDTNGASCKYVAHRPISPRELPTCLDVYEWQAPGAPGGNCTKAEVHGGCLYLLSAGNSDDPSFFIDASSDGSNVFIATSSSLVPTDRDKLTDLYNVRPGGGLASQFTLPGAPCEGEACRSSAAAPPAAVTPGTSTFVSPGNAKPKKPDQKKKKHKKKKHKKKQAGKAHTKRGHAGSNKGGQK